jgi:20S proteasome alpha/beta subunit
VTGTSVLAIKYADGVMMASDMLGARASAARCLARRVESCLSC